MTLHDGAGSGEQLEAELQPIGVEIDVLLDRVREFETQVVRDAPGLIGEFMEIVTRVNEIHRMITSSG